MISTELLDGQGLGNQLWCYVVTRAIAMNKGYEFGVQHPQRFKGKNLFKNLQMNECGPLPVLNELCVRHPNTADISPLDPFLQNPPDNHCLMGTMQAEGYIESRKQEIKQWLTIRDEWRYDVNEDVGIINIRGGEFKHYPELILPRDYWVNAIKKMHDILGKSLNWIVVSDDPIYARYMFPQYEAIHNCLEQDYSIIHNAKYTIISNSSFAWFPVWTSNVNEVCIAPKYWARHNISDGYWSNGDSLTKNWLWLDRDNNLQTYEECRKEIKDA